MADKPYSHIVKREAITMPSGRHGWRDRIACRCGHEFDMEYAGAIQYSVPCPACGRHFCAYTNDVDYITC